MSQQLIDDACRFGSELTEGELKSLIQSFNDILIRFGFNCSDKAWDDQNLPAIFTAFLGYIYNIVSDLGNNQTLFDCLWENFICQAVNDKFWCDVAVNGGSPVSITLPLTGGPYKVIGGLWAGGDTLGQINSGGFTGGEIDDSDDTYLAWVAAPMVAAGTTYNASDINPDVTDDVEGSAMFLFAIDLGCA